MTTTALTLMTVALFPFALWLAADRMIALLVWLEHPHPTYRPDPDVVYDQFADDPDVAAWENELAGGCA